MRPTTRTVLPLGGQASLRARGKCPPFRGDGRVFEPGGNVLPSGGTGESSSQGGVRACERCGAGLAVVLRVPGSRARRPPSILAGARLLSPLDPRWRSSLVPPKRRTPGGVWELRSSFPRCLPQESRASKHRAPSTAQTSWQPPRERSHRHPMQPHLVMRTPD